MSKQYFELAPVSEKPEKDGRYFVINNLDYEDMATYEGGKWIDMDPDDGSGDWYEVEIKSWLRPVSLPVQDGEEVDGFDNYYQPLFDLLHHEHNLLPLASEMNDIIEVVNKMQTDAEIKTITPTPTVTTQGEGSIETVKNRFKHVICKLGQGASIGGSIATLLTDTVFDNFNLTIKK